MKLLKKFFVVLLAFTTLLSACTVPATSDNSGAGGGPSTDAKNPQTPDEEHLQTNTLHKVTVNYTNKPFIVNGQSDYQVVIPNAFNSDIQTAANHLVKYLKMATECELKVVNSKSINWNSNSKFIIIGRDDLFKKAGLKMPEEDIGLSGYN